MILDHSDDVRRRQVWVVGRRPYQPTMRQALQREDEGELGPHGG